MSRICSLDPRDRDRAVSVRDPQGRSLYDLAKAAGNDESMTILARYGADLRRSDEEHMKPSKRFGLVAAQLRTGGDWSHFDDFPMEQVCSRSRVFLNRHSALVLDESPE